MTEILIAKIDVAVNGYSRYYTNDLLIFHLIICYINGDEGVISINYDDSMLDIVCTIVQQSKSEAPQRIGCDLDILKYVYSEKPDRKQFCVDMRINYNYTTGYACKEYQYIENQ
eukprot:263415_1